jgi:WD40 repeat protein
VVLDYDEVPTRTEVWKNHKSIENAHTGHVYALGSMENQLYSSSNKNLKIWDINTMTPISDIEAH